MAAITIRQLDETLKVKLRIQAASHGRSMEEEARAILRNGLSTSSPRKMNLAESIRRHIIPLGGVELAIPVREAVRRPPDFS